MRYGILLVKQNLQICRKRTYLHSYALLSSVHWGHMQPRLISEEVLISSSSQILAVLLLT